jgi:curli biogenesis system outer membrane secretion channel CsgG
VKLTEGKNKIEVQAYDSSGNRTIQGFSVTRKVPTAFQTSSRMTITILPFEISQKRSHLLTELAYEHMTNSFLSQGRFSVIERAKLEQILLEHKLAAEELTDIRHSVKVGRLMSADTILATSVKEDAKSTEVISRVIDTETAEIMTVKDAYSEDESSSSIRKLMDSLALKIANSFPVVEGIVVRKEKGYSYADLGRNFKIKKNMRIIFCREGKEIRHPLTGKSLGRDIVILGEGRVNDIQDNFSKIKLVRTYDKQNIQVKDIVVTK